MKRAWLLLLFACGEAPSSDLPRPNGAQILVYFPVGEGGRGLVRGRGRAGTFSPEDRVPYAQIRSFPSADNAVVVPVDPDGGFTFALRASGREVLEVGAASDLRASRLGPTTFVEIPPTPLPPGRQICCRNPSATAGRCVLRSQAVREFNLDVDAGERDSEFCPTPDIALFSCQDDRACLIFERRHYPADPDAISITAPNADGTITVSGQLMPDALILLENRGLTGLGETGRVFRDNRIADPDGAFSFEAIPGRGDDELIIEAIDLNDFRTPSVSLPVPDPEIESVDLVEVWPTTDLNNGSGAILGFRFFLTGVDGRGLCPDAPELSPAYCHRGGLGFDAIRFVSATIDDTPVQLCPALAPGEEPWANCADPGGVTRLALEGPRRGADGNVRAEPNTIALVVDLATPGNARPYFIALRDYARYLPRRFRVGLFFAGGSAPEDTEFMSKTEAADRIAQLTCIDQDSTCVPATALGPVDLFEAGARAATAVLQEVDGERTGRVVLTARSVGLLPATDAAGNAFERMVDVVQSGRSVRPGIPVDVAVIGADSSAVASGGETLGELLESVSQFSGSPERRGRVFMDPNVERPNVFEQRRFIRDARGWASGGLLLLYELLPVSVDGLDQVGKLGELNVQVEIRLPDAEPRIAAYRGPLEFQRVEAN